MALVATLLLIVSLGLLIGRGGVGVGRLAR